MDEAQFLEELKKDFYNEAESLIEMLESNILIVEKDPDNDEAINEIFRAAHTLKGGSATLDLDRIASFTHEMENLLEEIRSGNIKLTPELVDLLLKSLDVVKTLISASLSEQEAATGYEDTVINALKQASTGQPLGSSPQVAERKESSPGVSTKAELILNEYERYLVKKAPAEGYVVYEVYVKFDEKNPMKTVSGLQIHSQLKEVSDILKSIPDIDELMGDEFFNEVQYLVQSELKPEDIYKKVYLSDVTELVEVTEFTEEIEEAKDIISEDKSMSLSEDDLSEIQNQLQKGKRVYKVLVTFDDENPMRSVSGVLFYTMLRTKGEVLKSSPTYDEFKEDMFYPSGEFILSSPHETQDLRSKLYLSDVTKELKFQEFKSDKNAGGSKPVDRAAEQASAPQKTESAAISSSAVLASPSPPVESKSSAAVSKDTASDSGDADKKHQVSSVLRVESARIDEMLNLVGELVIIKASFFQLNENSSLIFDELNNVISQFRVMIRQLLGDVENHFDGNTSGNGNGGNGQQFASSGVSRDARDGGEDKEYFKERLEQLSTHFDNIMPENKAILDKLKGSSQSLGRITDDLQESVMKVRMVPINQIFSRFPRLVRDISRNLHKNINLVMEGEDTELDKSVIEDLVDPLIHIVRNAVDHAIETPAVRQKAGKDPAGTIILKAGHEGNTVTITVQDDGQGIDIERVRQKAIENKLIDANQDLSQSEIVKLIFEPGFSTAKEVTSLSGRGVGMDVVRKKIENIGGDVEIETTTGLGSTFHIKIPLTLAIIQALLVSVGEYTYSIPINSVIETLRIGPDEVELLENTEVIRVRDEVLSLVHLDQLFKHTSKREDEFFYVIVVGTSGKKVGLGVDNLIGEQDVVIKPLNNKYTNVPGIAGATILGDGQVSLVVDVISLFSLISTKRRHLLALNK